MSEQKQDGSINLKKDDSNKNLSVIGGSGILSFDGDLKIAGAFHGNLSVKGKLFIEAGAHVNGSIQCICLDMSGKYSGHAVITNKCVLHNGSVFSGQLSANDVDFKDGCVFNAIHGPYQASSVQSTSGETPAGKEDEKKNRTSLLNELFK